MFKIYLCFFLLFIGIVYSFIHYLFISKKSIGKPRAALISIIISIVTLLIIIMWMPRRMIKNDSLVIKGLYGISKEIKVITIADTVSALPETIKVENGISALGIYKGAFSLNDKGPSLLFLYKNKPPYIFIEYKRSRYIYFNFWNVEKTKDFYRKLRVKKDKGELP